MAYRSHHSMTDTDGWTYLIAAPSVGLVKIGTAKDYMPRLKSIQVCSPVDVELVALIKGRGHEPRLHREFADWRVRGEWFDIAAPGLEEVIDQHAWIGRIDTRNLV